MTGNFFAPKNEKQVDAALKAALPDYFPSAELINDPEGSGPMMAVSIDGRILRATGRTIELSDVAGLIHRLLDAALPVSQSPVRAAVILPDGNGWVYDHGRDEEPWPHRFG